MWKRFFWYWLQDEMVCIEHHTMRCGAGGQHVTWLLWTGCLAYNQSNSLKGGRHAEEDVMRFVAKNGRRSLSGSPVARMPRRSSV